MKLMAMLSIYILYDVIFLYYAQSEHVYIHNISQFKSFVNSRRIFLERSVRAFRERRSTIAGQRKQDINRENHREHM